MSDVTRILDAIQAGEPQAAAELLPLVYQELRKLAAAKLAKERPGQTLEATALVHEAYLRLVGPSDAKRWKDRGHFFAAAAEAMRHILVDNARRKRRAKHGGGRTRVDLDQVDLDQAVPAPPTAADGRLALDEAMEKLAAQDPQAAALVKLRYFAGLSVDESARALNISRASAYSDWNFARAWLLKELRRDEPA